MRRRCCTALASTPAGLLDAAMDRAEPHENLMRPLRLLTSFAAMILSPERRKALTSKAQSYAANLDRAMPYLESRGIAKEVGEMFMLGYVPYGDEYAGRLCIPYSTPAGVVQIKYRCADVTHGNHKNTTCSKYLYESGCGSHLYNARVLNAAVDLVVVTEGELDATCVQAYCGIPAVAYPGAKMWKGNPHYRLCFDAVREVVVIADGDTVGREAAAYVADSIGQNARVVNLPGDDGTDSNDFIINQGVQAFTERIYL